MRRVPFLILMASVGFVSRARAQTTEQGERSRGFSEPSPGVAALTPTVLGEVDYRVYPTKIEGNTGFALARLRPGLQLTAAAWFRAATAIEFAGEHPAILDAYARLRAARWLEFTIGYSKPPLFASATYEPIHTLPFPDRAPVVTSFRVRRDLGADVHFNPREVPIEAWVRVGNGAGSPLGNDNALPAGYAALDLVLGRGWVDPPLSERTFGLRLGAGALVEDSEDRDGISGQTPMGFVYFRPIVISGLRQVTEAHAVAYAGPLRLTLEAATARESRSRDDDGNPNTPRIDLDDLRSHGATAELAWVIRGEPRDVGRAPGPSGNGSGWSDGALELAARYDGMWLGRGASEVRAGGSQGGAVALKWWPASFLSATLAGYLTRYDFAPIEEPAERWSWGTLLRASFFWSPQPIVDPAIVPSEEEHK